MSQIYLVSWYKCDYIQRIISALSGVFYHRIYGTFTTVLLTL